MKLFGDLSDAEQSAIRAAHEAGRIIELHNGTMGVWVSTGRPAFCPDLYYRVAPLDATPTEWKWD